VRLHRLRRIMNVDKKHDLSYSRLKSAKVMPPSDNLPRRRHVLCDSQLYPCSTETCYGQILVTKKLSSKMTNTIVDVRCNVRSNYALDRTGDAGHKACGASFAPKAHRFPRSADGDARRSGHRWR